MRAVKSNHCLFHGHICLKQVPMMLTVTGLGKTKWMEDWWDKHKNDCRLKVMSLVDHVCITVLQSKGKEQKRKYEKSKQTTNGLLRAPSFLSSQCSKIALQQLKKLMSGVHPSWRW